MGRIKLFEEFLTEKKSTGVIYHYTTPENLNSILSADEMHSGHQHISFSRNYDLKEWYDKYEAYCRIAFDGDSMSNKFSIKPYLFDPTKTTLFGGGSYISIADRRKFYGSEREERIMGEVIRGVKKYIIQVDVLNPVKSEEDMNQIKDAETKGPSIKINYVNKFRPVKAQ